MITAYSKTAENGHIFEQTYSYEISWDNLLKPDVARNERNSSFLQTLF